MKAMKVAPIDATKLAVDGKEFLALVKSDADWIIRSEADLHQLRESDEDTVFASLPEPDFQAFVSSLKFESGGVCTGYYKSLMASLTLSQIYEVFSYFGMSREYFIETQEAACIGHGCEFQFWSFCASTCGDGH
ncbi:hypothetical protein ACWGIA_17535 [Streptomyces bobili]